MGGSGQKELEEWSGAPWSKGSWGGDPWVRGILGTGGSWVQGIFVAGDLECGVS